MNSNLQIDLHPDADTLNAFAEQALGAAEREQILAHMTRCSRCRQVIYMAQKAAEAEDMDTPSGMPSERWYKSWRFAWVPAAALAAALALVVTFYPRLTAPAPEIAKVVPQGAPVAPTPVPPLQASAETAPRPVPQIAASSAAGNQGPAALRRPSGELPLETAPPAGRAPREINAAPSPSSESGQMLTRLQSPAQFNPEPAVGALQQQGQQTTGGLSASANTTQASQESMKKVMDRAQASRKVPVFAAVSRAARQAAPPASFGSGKQEAVNSLAPSSNENLPVLPSGLSAISTATIRQRTLTIDIAGALFLSEDAGKHWEPVAPQWTGRAVVVRMQARAGGAVFQLSNASGFSWTSTDGKAWTVQ